MVSPEHHGRNWGLSSGPKGSHRAHGCPRFKTYVLLLKGVAFLSSSGILARQDDGQLLSARR